MKYKMDERYKRQIEIINIEKFEDNTISIIGCGAVGSFTAMCLTKMGWKRFNLWDFDKVEEHNLPNQFFKEIQIGRTKIDATFDNMIEMDGKAIIQLNNKKFDKSSVFNSQIVISCVDKMYARKTIFEKCLRDKKVQLFIDTRMAGLQGQIYSIDLKDKLQIENYKKTLFSDTAAVQERCTAKAVIFTVLGISSVVCNQITKALNGEKLNNYIVLDYNTNQVY